MHALESSLKASLVRASFHVAILGGCAMIGVGLANRSAASPPAFGPIPDQTVLEDQPTHRLELQVSNVQRPVAELLWTAVCSDPILVPEENFAFGVAAGDHPFLTVTPAFGRTGTATITVTVSEDGVENASQSFLLAVAPPPTGWVRFANPSPIVIPDLGAATPYPSRVNVSGLSGAITNVTLTLSRLTHERIGDVSMLLVSPAGLGVVIFSGAGGERDIHGVTVHLTDASPAPLPKDSDLWSEPLDPADYAAADYFPGAPIGLFGPVAFGSFNGLNANGDWSLFVYDDRSPSHGQILGGWSLMIATSLSTPTISAITNVIASAGTPTGPIPFTVDDLDTPASELVVATDSSEPTLIPVASILVAGTQNNRTLTLTPAAGRTGRATVRLTVSDGSHSSTRSFFVTILAAGSPAATSPTISAIPDQTVNPGEAVGPIPFLVGDVDTPLNLLTVTATSSNQTLVPDANIFIFHISSSEKSVTVYPVPGEVGQARIQLLVNDGLHTTAQGFLLTVKPPGLRAGMFTNASTISIPSVGLATPYPSTIDVSGMVGGITELTITLDGFGHAYPDDVDMLLVGPTGRGVVIFSDCGGGYRTVDQTVTLADGAFYPLPDSAGILPGTYKPANYDSSDLVVPPDAFPTPAPPGPYGATLSEFNGLSPNGTWSLYVVDSIAPDAGEIRRGWRLTIATSATAPRLQIANIESAGMVLLRMTGESSQSFSLETSENLVTWNALDVLRPITGSMTYRDPRPAGPSQRYYRLRAVSGP